MDHLLQHGPYDCSIDLQDRNIENRLDRHIDLHSWRCICGNTNFLLHMRVAHNACPLVYSHLAIDAIWISQLQR